MARETVTDRAALHRPANAEGERDWILHRLAQEPAHPAAPAGPSSRLALSAPGHALAALAGRQARPAAVLSPGAPAPSERGRGHPQNEAAATRTERRWLRTECEAAGWADQDVLALDEGSLEVRDLWRERPARTVLRGARPAPECSTCCPRRKQHRTRRTGRRPRGQAPGWTSGAAGRTPPCACGGASVRCARAWRDRSCAVGRRDRLWSSKRIRRGVQTLPGCEDLSGALHSPLLSGTRCGLPTKLSAMTRVVRRVPGIVGVKWTLTVQPAYTPTVVPVQV
jgi:hypothetical protein